MNKVRVRFAPSPTGFLHIGGLRTALYNYLFAKKNGGDYILRIEDTDRTRYVEGAIEALIDSCKWAGFVHDEGPYVQSERLEIYKKYAKQLIADGHAYYCFCGKERLEKVREAQEKAGETTKYDGHCRDISIEEAEKRIAAGEEYVVRLKLPKNRDIKFVDLIKGEVTVNTDDLDDQVLMKSDGFPTYHMAVVVDDHDMGITHVLRGDEWLISTPKHVYLYEAFGWEAPTYVHLPVILGVDKKKLSKRQGDVSVQDFQRRGFLPEALVNYIALVGWSPEDGTEFMSMDELVDKFSLERISHSGGVFSVDKLKWMNNHYMRQADPERLLVLAKPFFVAAGYCDEVEFEEHRSKYGLILEILKERLGSLDELGEFQSFFTASSVEPENDEAREIVESEEGRRAVKALWQKLRTGDSPMTADAFKATLKEIQSETGLKGKNLFMPVRIAISGQMHGPDLAATAEIMGRDVLLRRLDHALGYVLEACVSDVVQAQSAKDLGADRIEFCDRLDLGGITHSLEELQKASEIGVPLAVMIRPRGGNFVFTEDEIRQMIEQMQERKNVPNVHSFVIGVLTEDGHIEQEQLKRLVQAAAPIKTVFHMAFDEAIDVDRLQILKSAGVDYVLTKGGKDCASENIETLRKLVDETISIDGPAIVVGGSVLWNQWREIAEITGVLQFHGKRVVGELCGRE